MKTTQIIVTGPAKEGIFYPINNHSWPGRTNMTNSSVYNPLLPIFDSSGTPVKDAEKVEAERGFFIWLNKAVKVITNEADIIYYTDQEYKFNQCYILLSEEKDTSCNGCGEALNFDEVAYENNSGDYYCSDCDEAIQSDPESAIGLIDDPHEVLDLTEAPKESEETYEKLKERLNKISDPIEREATEFTTLNFDKGTDYSPFTAAYEGVLHGVQFAKHQPPTAVSKEGRSADILEDLRQILLHIKSHCDISSVYEPVQRAHDMAEEGLYKIKAYAAQNEQKGDNLHHLTDEELLKAMQDYHLQQLKVDKKEYYEHLTDTILGIDDLTEASMMYAVERCLDSASSIHFFHGARWQEAQAAPSTHSSREIKEEKP